jgi:hypothetical protein
MWVINLRLLESRFGVFDQGEQVSGISNAKNWRILLHFLLIKYLNENATK